MVIWLHKDFETIEEDEDLVPITFEEPDDKENWTKLTTREELYKEMLEDLESLGKEYKKGQNFQAERVCEDFAHRIRGRIGILWH